MSSLIVPSRRGFIAGIASLIAAPAIVRASSLMPVRALEPRWMNITWMDDHYKPIGHQRLLVRYTWDDGFNAWVETEQVNFNTWVMREGQIEKPSAVQTEGSLRIT